MLAFALAATLLLPLASAPVTPKAEADPLEKLVGGWKVTGTIRGKPIKQALYTRRVLGNTFVELHFTSDEAPREGMAPYEAYVFIGWDAAKGRYVAHWMDVFGASGADVVGTGKRLPNGIVLEFPYATGLFRDTFTFDAATSTWRLLIESRDKSGAWTVFADERFESEDVLK